MQSKFVVLYQGRRGLPGPQGVGDPGPQGPGFRARGAWSVGQTYAPGDAVSADSTPAQGISSLFIQRDSVLPAVSNTPPRDDPARWLEIGVSDLSDFTGAIWRVTQYAHGFTRIGTPIGFNDIAQSWVEASNKTGEEVAVGVVRDIISADEFVVQTSGRITGLDPAAIEPGAAQFLPGRFYFVASLRGKLTLSPTLDAPNYSSNAMLLATGPTSGVVLQWQQTPNVVGRRPVGFRSYFYTATAGQTVFSGPDLASETLVYEVSDQTQVFVDGAALSSLDEFTASTGVSVTVAAAATGGERVEIRVLSEPLQAIAPATSLVADNLAAQFNGATTRFPLTVGGGNPLTLGPSQNAFVWLDGSSQEPFTDFTLVAGTATDTDIVFATAPAAGTRFWAVVGAAVSNLNFLQVSTLIAQTLTTDVLNFTSAAGGTVSVTDVTAQNVTAATSSLGAATAATITTGTLTVSGGSTFDTVAADDIAANTAAITAITSLSISTDAIAALSAALTGATITTLSSTSATITNLTVSANISTNNLSATADVSAGVKVTAPLGELTTVRAAVLRGPTAGGAVVASDIEIDEGTF